MPAPLPRPSPWPPSARNLTAVLAVLPGVLLAILVVRYWVNLPVSDEWTTSTGYTLAKAREHTLALPYLFSQHTDSRPFFPRLLALALNVGGGGWDLRRGMLLNLGLAAGTSALLWRLLPREGPAWSRWLALAAMNTLLFSPVGWELWLWGQGSIVFLTVLCLAGILAVNASALSLRTKAGLNALLAFVGTFCFSSGLLLWPLGWPARGAARTGENNGRGPRAAYVAAGVASLGLFFAGFRPADRTALFYALTHPGTALRYFLTWCAGPFRPGGAPDAWHALVGAAVLGAFALGAGRAWRTDRRTAWPWLALGAFAVGSGLLAAAGRTQAGLGFALSSRYAVTAALLPVAALGAWWTAGLQDGGLRRSGLTTAAVWLGLAGLLLHARAFGESVELMRGSREAREKARDALQFIDLMPENPQFRPIFPELTRDAGALRVAFHRLQAVGLVPVPPGAPALEATLGKLPPPGEAGTAGMLDGCAPRGVEQLVVRGWARDPGTTLETSSAAPFVVFQWTPLDAAGTPAGRPRPWTVLRPERPRPDVASALGRPALGRCGFEEAIYRPLTADGAGPGRVAAWAVDPATGAARPLGHTFDVPAAREP